MPSSYLGSGATEEEIERDGDQKVVAFMLGTFDYMLHTKDPYLGWGRDRGRLIQRWLWFSLNVPMYLECDPDHPKDCWWVGFNGWLYDWQETHNLTVFGEAYRDYVLDQVTPTFTPSPTTAPSATPTVTLTPTQT